VRDEHSTRSCPIGKTCFTCGMKGHINKVRGVPSSMSVTNCAPWQNCPNRYSRGRVNNYDDCDRCGSDKHNTNVRSISAGYSIMRLFVPDFRSRNAPLSGDCMIMLPIVNERLFSSFGIQNNHLLSARVGRATSQMTSGATIAEATGTSVTYV
jgi:hypothetical protein